MAARSFPTPRWIAVTVAAAAVLIASLYGFHSLEQFLIGDPRFVLNGQPGDGSESLQFPAPRTSPRGPSKPYSPRTSAAAPI